METAIDLFLLVAAFAIIALSAGEVGKLFTRLRLPLISGFLFTGIIAGPFVLGLIPAEATTSLRFIDEVALAFIAFAAGNELYLKELRSRLRSIAWVTIGLVTFTFTLGSLGMILLAEFIPFTRDLPLAGRVAVAIIAGTILVARSPTAAIAVINELRAKGPFTQTVLGVTVIMDVVVITLFASNSSLAITLLNGSGFDPGFIGLIVLELILALLLGLVLARILRFFLGLSLHRLMKTVLTLLSGYAVFVLTSELRAFSHERLPVEVLLEPLLICLIAAFVITNSSPYRDEFGNLLRSISLPIYIAFFTLTGASLNIDILTEIWPIALGLFAIRLLGISLGSFLGGVIAGEPMKHNRIRWMAFITQAGIALGLAREAAATFPTFGPDLATVIIALVVLNEIIGPILFKGSINIVEESHTRAHPADFDGVRDAIIFGLERQGIVLARNLQAHGWQVKIAALLDRQDTIATPDVTVHHIAALEPETLRELDAEHANAIVCMFTSDEENYRVCALIYEHYGIETVVVRLNDLANTDRFRKLGALIVDPSTATVQLLEEFVRTPSTTSLLLGMAGNQDILELEISDPSLHGVTLRDLRLPLDVLVLSVRRRGQVLISHGYTRLEFGDRVTVVGSTEGIERVAVLLRQGPIKEGARTERTDLEA